MNFYEAPIKGVFIIEPKVFRDERGSFFESYNQAAFEKATGAKPRFVQDNYSFSRFGVMRGLHCQTAESAQAKIVRATLGRVLDVVVDIRPGSETYGAHFSIELSAENRKQMFIPRGFAHGFIVLSEYAEFVYKCDNLYAPGKEGGLYFADPALGIDWKLPKDKIVVSEKDKHLPMLKDISYQFKE